MIEKLIELVYSKIEEDEIAFNKSAKSQFLSDKFFAEYNIILDKRTYLRYYEKYVLKQVNKAGKPELKLLNAYSKYLGFENYDDFINQKGLENLEEEEEIITKDNHKDKTQKNRIKESQINKQTTPYRIITISILGIIALVLYIFSTFTNFFKKENTINPVTVNIENFNANQNYYYYYDNDGKIALLNDTNILQFKEKNTKPITKQVLNTYFHQQGKDTTTQQYKIVQANYFSKDILPITDIKQVEESTVIPTKLILEENPVKEEAPIKSESPITEKEIQITNTALDKTNNTLLFNVLNDDAIDYQVLSLFKKKYTNSYQINKTTDKKANFICNGSTTYTYRKSKRDKNRVICDFALVYQINKSSTKEIIEIFSKKVIGTGFSEKAAKDNALKKMTLILQ